MNTQKLLVAVLVLQSVALLGQWTGSGAVTPASAQGNALSSGSRDLMIVDELKALNGKLDRLNSTLESGKLQVEVRKLDEKNEKK